MRENSSEVVFFFIAAHVRASDGIAGNVRTVRNLIVGRPARVNAARINGPGDFIALVGRIKSLRGDQAVATTIRQYSRII